MVLEACVKTEDNKLRGGKRTHVAVEKSGMGSNLVGETFSIRFQLASIFASSSRTCRPRFIRSRSNPWFSKDSSSVWDHVVLTQSFGTPAYLHREGIRDAGWMSE